MELERLFLAWLLVLACICCTLSAPIAADVDESESSGSGSGESEGSGSKKEDIASSADGEQENGEVVEFVGGSGEVGSSDREKPAFHPPTGIEVLENTDAGLKSKQPATENAKCRCCDGGDAGGGEGCGCGGGCCGKHEHHHGECHDQKCCHCEHGHHEHEHEHHHHGHHHGFIHEWGQEEGGEHHGHEGKGHHFCDHEHCHEHEHCDQHHKGHHCCEEGHQHHDDCHHDHHDCGDCEDDHGDHGGHHCCCCDRRSGVLAPGAEDKEMNKAKKKKKAKDTKATKKQSVHIGYGYASGDNYRLGSFQGGMGGLSSFSQFEIPNNKIVGRQHTLNHKFSIERRNKMHQFPVMPSQATPYGHPVTHPGFTTMGYPGHALASLDVRNRIMRNKRHTYGQFTPEGYMRMMQAAMVRNMAERSAPQEMQDEQPGDIPDMQRSMIQGYPMMHPYPPFMYPRQP